MLVEVPRRFWWHRSIPDVLGAQWLEKEMPFSVTLWWPRSASFSYPPLSTSASRPPSLYSDYLVFKWSQGSVCESCPLLKWSLLVLPPPLFSLYSVPLSLVLSHTLHSLTTLHPFWLSCSSYLKACPSLFHTCVFLAALMLFEFFIGESPSVPRCRHLMEDVHCSHAAYCTD